MHEALIEIGALPIQPMVAAHFTVITHENNNRIITQPRSVKVRKQSSKLVIDQLYFRIVISEMLPFFFIRKRTYGLRLAILSTLNHILLLMGGLPLHLTVFPERQRHIFYAQPVFVFLRRIQRRMRIEGIHADQPRFPGISPALNKIDGLLHTPCSLVVLCGNAHLLPRKCGICLRRPRSHSHKLAAVDFFPVDAFFIQPVLIIIPSILPVIMRMVTVLEIGIPVITPLLHSAFRRCQMKLARQAACIPFISQQLRHQFFIF